MFAKYVTYFKLSWQYHLEFRADAILKLLGSAFSILLAFYLWNYIFTEEQVVAGYNKAQIITYYIFANYLFASIFMLTPTMDYIRTGYLSQLLIRPINTISLLYCHDLAKLTIRLLLGLPAIIALYLIFPNQLFLVTDPMAYMSMILATLGAFTILFFFGHIISCLEFWMIYADSVYMFIDPIIWLLSGTMIPLAIFPSSIQTIISAFPFKYTNNFIIDVFLGRLSLTETLSGFGMQIFWIIVLAFIASLCWKAGLKKYEAYGS